MRILPNTNPLTLFNITKIDKPIVWLDGRLISAQVLDFKTKGELQRMLFDAYYKGMYRKIYLYKITDTQIRAELYHV